jgi:hypothetical protein
MPELMPGVHCTARLTRQTKQQQLTDATRPGTFLLVLAPLELLEPVLPLPTAVCLLLLATAVSLPPGCSSPLVLPATTTPAKITHSVKLAEFAKAKTCLWLIEPAHTLPPVQIFTTHLQPQAWL